MNHLKRPQAQGSKRGLVAALFPGREAPFAGNSLLPAESCVHPKYGPPILALGAGEPKPAQDEVNMANRVNRVNRAKAQMQTTSKNLHAVAGAILFSFGLTLLTANLDAVAAQVSTWFTSAPGSLGTAIEVGLAGLRAVQAYFFDPSAFQAGFLSILVSLWPLILVIIGAILLRDAMGMRFARAKLAQRFPSGEYERES